MIRQASAKRLSGLAEMRRSVEGTRPLLVARLIERPDAPDGASDAYRLVIEHLVAELLALERRLDDAERAYDAAKLRVAELRGKRDRARSSLARRHSRILRFLETFYQPWDLAMAGVTVGTPDGALALVRSVKPVVEFLRRIDEAGPPILEVSFDGPAMADELESVACKLKKLIYEAQAANVETVTARSLAGKATAEVDRLAPAIRRCVESLCRLAGGGLVRRLAKW